MKRVTNLIALILVFIIGFNVNTYAADVLLHGNDMVTGSPSEAESIPEGFTQTTVEYIGEQLDAIYNESAGIYMVYLKSEENSALDGFYPYSEEDGFNAELSIETSAKNLQISSPGSDISIPQGYTRQIITVNNIPVIAYKSETDDGTNNVLVYGSINGTEYNWFLFNPDDMTCNRVIIDDTLKSRVTELEEANASLEDKYNTLNKQYNSNIDKARLLYLIEFVISVIAIFLMINAMIKRRHKKIDYEDRILDLKINKGIETLPASNAELRKRDKDQEKAKERRRKYFGDEYYDKGNYYPESAARRKEKHERSESEPVRRRPKSNPNNKFENKIENKTPNIDAKKRLERKLNQQSRAIQRPQAQRRRPMPQNNIDIGNLEKSLEKMSENTAKEAKKERIQYKSNPIGGITGSMDFGDDLDITTINLDE